MYKMMAPSTDRYVRHSAGVEVDLDLLRRFENRNGRPLAHPHSSANHQSSCIAKATIRQLLETPLVNFLTGNHGATIDERKSQHDQ